MNLQEAFRKSIKAYFNGKQPKASRAVGGKRVKYDKKYFDRIEEERFGEVTTNKTDGTVLKKGKKNG